MSETLQTAKFGLDDLMATSPARRLSGLRNLIVFGRAVTNVLQKLRSREPGFDEWYAPYVDEMRQDPLLRYFYELRSKILKEGEMQTGIRLNLFIPSFAELTRNSPKPPNARGFFIGDATGGSGWEIVLDDGTVEKYYVQLPDDLAHVEITLPQAPNHHLGAHVGTGEHSSVGELAALYFSYLERLVRAAQTRFGTAT